jgi:hypothetical protein
VIIYDYTQHLRHSIHYFTVNSAELFFDDLFGLIDQIVHLTIGVKSLVATLGNNISDVGITTSIPSQNLRELVSV